MKEKTTPTYALHSFKAAVSSKEDLAQCITFSAARTAFALGFGPDEVLATIQAMESGHFYKSMSSLGNVTVWQDIYHVPYGGLLIYIKFRADVITRVPTALFQGEMTAMNKQNKVNQEVKHSCPECGSNDMVQGVRTQTVEYGGLVSEPYEQPGLWCQSCGEGLISLKEMEVGSREMHKLKAQVENLLQPSEVRRVRKKLGLTQKEAGLILGGGQNAFQKYESADVLTSQAISNLLRVLEHDPSALEVLRRENTPRAARAAKSLAQKSVRKWPPSPQ